MTAAGKILLVAAGATFALFVVEVVLRVTVTRDELVLSIIPDVPDQGARWVDHPFLPFVGRPNARYSVLVPENDSRIVTHAINNAWGFRAHEFPAEKQPEDFFIVVLGGSTTWGASAQTNADTWPEILERKLGARYPSRNVRVFNLGTQNATTAYSVVVLALIGVHLGPDLVIVYQGFNDYGPAIAVGYRPDHAHFYKDLDLGGARRSVQLRFPAWMRRSYALILATGRIDQMLDANSLSSHVQHPIVVDPTVQRTSETDWAALSRNWRHLETIASIASGADAAVLFSTFQFFDALGQQEINDSLRTLFEANGLPYVDQDALLADGDRTINFDECHFTAQGRELVAENFFKHIVDHGLVPATAHTGSTR